MIRRWAEGTEPDHIALKQIPALPMQVLANADDDSGTVSERTGLETNERVGPLTVCESESRLRSPAGAQLFTAELERAESQWGGDQRIVFADIDGRVGPGSVRPLSLEESFCEE